MFNINNLLLKHHHNSKIFTTAVSKTGDDRLCSAGGAGVWATASNLNPNPDPGGGSGRYLPLKFLNNSTTARSLPLPPPSPRPAAAGCAALAARARVGNGLKLRPSVDTEERYAQHATTQQLAIVSPVSRRSAGTENNFRYCPDRKLNLF